MRDQPLHDAIPEAVRRVDGDAARAEACPGCGVVIPTGTAAHQNIGSSAGCWAAYGDVLARELGEWGYPPIHRLTVDTYSAQHPGESSRKAIQSVGVHLIALYLSLERDIEPHRITRELGRLVADHSALRWLEPPPPGGALTILDVRGAHDLRDHTSRVQRWARSVWESWSDHHDTVRQWAGR
jgi:hypothetical protein